MTYFINQLETHDCAFASLKMLLANVLKSRKFLYLKPEFPSKSYSLKELIMAAKNYGVTLKGFKYVKKEELFSSKINKCLLTINLNENLHMVYCQKITKKKIYIYDPEYGKIVYKKEDFLTLWNGQILEIEKVSKDHKNISTNKIQRFYAAYLLNFFQIILFGFFMIFSLFIDKNINFIIVISLFIVFILMNLIFENLIFSTSSKFDKYLDRLDLDGIKNISLFYKKYLDNKVVLFTYPIKFINILLITTYLVFILVLNSYLNAFIFGILLILNLCFYFVFNNKNKINVMKLSLLENKLDYKTNSIKERFKKIEKAGNELILKKNLIRYINVTLITVLVLFLAAFQDQISLNFILFHFLSYSIFITNLDKIINFENGINRYKKAKNFFIYYQKNE